ncbi:MAG: hypothetical protein WBN39_14035 [Flavobacteriaceae bacterium]
MEEDSRRYRPSVVGTLSIRGMGQFEVQVSNEGTAEGFVIDQEMALQTSPCNIF